MEVGEKGRASLTHPVIDNFLFKQSRWLYQIWLGYLDVFVVFCSRNVNIRKSKPTEPTNV